MRRGEVGIGIHIAWSNSHKYLGFDAAYLRFPRRQPLHATSATLDFGFRSLRIESPLDEPSALEALSAVLVAARRGSCLLAASHLGADLSLLRSESSTSYRGISALAFDWGRRATASPALATLVDTEIDVPPKDETSINHLTGSPLPASSDTTVVAGVTEALRRLIRAAAAISRIVVLDDFDLAETVDAATWDAVPT